MIPTRSLSAQIAEVKREIALRKNVYPSFVARGKMRQGEADEHLLLMECVLETLLQLQSPERIRDEIQRPGP